MKNDPYSMKSRFPGACSKCGAKIKTGEDIFYYPKTRKVLSGECAEEALRDFQSHVFDEAQYNGRW